VTHKDLSVVRKLLENKSFDARLDKWDIEINEITQMFVSEFQMTKYLGRPHWIHFIHCLEFTDNEFIDQDVKSQSFFKDYSLVNNWNVELSLD
jgi:hypothetical protein